MLSVYIQYGNMHARTEVGDSIFASFFIIIVIIDPVK